MIFTSFRKGTSLLELIMFIGITTMMAGVVVSFSLLSSQVSIRDEVIANVNQTGNFATDMISRKVQAATSVAATANQLTLTMSDPSINPTIIELNEGRIRLTEGGTVTYITPATTEIENLNFTLLGQTIENKRGITVSFDIANKTEEDVASVFEYSQEFQTTIAGRGGAASSSSASSSPSSSSSSSSS
jgi:hypothetical protein